MNQQTIGRPVSFPGVGLWTGQPTTLRLVPAPVDSGIMVIKDGVCIRVSPDNCFFFKRGLGVRTGSATVVSVEHLLAALYGLAVDNIRIEVDGAEIPFTDGSALPFVRLVQEAGITIQNRARNYYYLKKPLISVHGPTVIAAFPASSLQIGFFFSPERRNGRKGQKRWMNVTIDTASFVKRIAFARTFGRFHEVERLKKSLPFSIVSESGILYPEKFRSQDELVGHKIVDFLGALALLSRRLQARIVALRSGHAEHLRLVKLLQKQH